METVTYNYLTTTNPYFYIYVLLINHIHPICAGLNLAPDSGFSPVQSGAQAEGTASVRLIFSVMAGA